MKPICGIIPPVVTPLAAQDQLDEPGLERLIEHILAGGVHGLFILGTTGEGPDCSYAVRRAMIDRTCRQVDGRVPVLVGITDTSYAESVSLANYAAECGADAVVAAPPYYFSVGQPELQDYFLDLFDKMPLPVMLYNMPSCTKVNIGIDVLRRLLEHPNMAGFKDSSGQMVYFHLALRLFADYPEKSILVGPEELLAESTLMGGHGGVSGGANVFPKLYVNLYNAAREGNLSETRRLHELVIRVTDLYRVGRHTSSTIKGIKAALGCLGICSDIMLEPFRHFFAEDRKRVQAVLDELLPRMT
ncbi:dihydrodipicolinate synthase family protein [Tichowtungia aerotolerans]|uniref:Dihydrodipicolinate synthase family protein n=1 Tax=Tichowtungia aerotolerans TaxID=2697043 RepID=A0A6P1MA47_9BACT|nr:dihydrodipicolinate synthase family protein [Tichowtungia aerotolerans]QHI69424.1 dihydrodipicolinate synthase family protein [Tichowtungia aerotolerans]